LNSDLKIGNIMKQSFVDILRGPELADIRNSWLRGNVPDICLECQRYLPLSVYSEKQYENRVKRYFRHVKSKIPF